MARAAKKPVSDLSLYLWLSAVLGVWCGCWLGLSLPPFMLRIPWIPMSVSFALIGVRSITPWSATFVTVAVALGVLILVAEQGTPHHTPRWWKVRLGLPISVAVGAAVIVFGADPVIVAVPSVRSVGVAALAAALILFVPLLVIQCILARFALWIGAIGLHAFRGFPNPIGLMECRSCRFDQTGLPEHELCPECGHPWMSRPEPSHAHANRWIRRLACASLVVAILVALINQIPKAVFFWHYRCLTFLPDRAERTNYSTRGSVITPPMPRTTFRVTAESGREHWLEMVAPFRYRLRLTTPSPTPITTYLFTDWPYRSNNVKPILEQPGFIPCATIRAIIDASSPPP